MEKTRIKIKRTYYEAAAPVIVSASRATDIPAFFGEWFIKRVRAGYCGKINPYSGKKEYISFANTRLFVFWTKNPEPFMPYLEELEKTGINYYFLYTLNDYEKEGLEPDIPQLSKRIKTFIKLSKMLGEKRVFWRFDPLIMMPGMTVEKLAAKIENIAKQIAPYTSILIFSFIDINKYNKVKNNADNSKSGIREFTEKEKAQMLQKLIKLTDKYGIKLSPCAVDFDLSSFGLKPGACIDPVLMADIFSADAELMTYIGANGVLLPAEMDYSGLKDKNQRKECLCAQSKDIGAYNTCGNGCIYCYAVKSHLNAAENMLVIKNRQENDTLDYSS
ncbi:MAG: DUF1848 domain-containing protein [Candidatus Goldbacteria bacterium]|nr:DUF1848 domain-containing protein [Candidatus Goldiibacteriota bacterium]